LIAGWGLTCGKVYSSPKPAREVGALFDSASINLKSDEFEFGIDNCARLLADHAAGKDILVFVHGYNNTLENTVRRARSFVEDVHFRGIFLVWSWPSAGVTALYTDDEKAIAWSADHFVDFITALMGKNKDLSIDFFAHSMGNHLLLELATRLKQDQLGWGRAIVFAAPDIASDEFVQRVLPDRFQTLYASQDDRALQLSAYLLHQNASRAGRYVQDTGVLIVPGVESIDAILRGHSYVFEDPRALRDLDRLINHQEKASNRGLTERHRGTSSYWVINP
jgi:esterase/lipase superfamily enzyme